MDQHNIITQVVEQVEPEVVELVVMDQVLELLQEQLTPAAVEVEWLVQRPVVELEETVDQE